MGNGGVKKYSDVNNLIKETGAIAWLIGRASIGNPWIFSNTSKEFISNYSLKKVIKTHLLWNVDFYGEKKGILNFRKHFLKYLQKLKNTKKIKEKSMKIEKVHDFIYLIESI